MEAERSALENRVEQLAGQMAELTRRVDQLSARLESAATTKLTAAKEVYAAGDGDASEELLSWVGKSSLLQRLSTLCFLLVVALILRTVTDSRLIDQQIGSLLGMGYASLLMVLGWRRYKLANPLAPIFTICGTVLMFTIVVETHAHFESLPSVPAYIMLMLTGLGMAALSYFYRVPAPISVGTLGMCLAGAAIDYPHPFFPYLGIVLLTANVLGYFTARAHKYSWLRWILLIVTMFMIHLWGLNLGVTLLGKGKIIPTLAPSLFLPLLSLFALTYAVTAFLRIRQNLTDRLARFDLLVPTLNVCWAFILARYVIFAMGGSTTLLGIVGVLAALAHLGLAWWLVKDKKNGAPGANAFVFAGAVLLAMALPAAAMGSILTSLPFLAALSYGLAISANQWENAAVRLTSYLLQIYAALALAFLFLTSAPDAHVIGATLSAALLACISLAHYKWCRSHLPPAHSAFFSKLDKNDLSAAVLLLVSLLSAFFMLRVVVYLFLGLSLPAAAIDNAFRSAQSVIINVSAAILMLFALAHQKKEVRNIAILVTVIGAIKVFLYDLIGGMHGLPLVISIFSFGITTALESFGLTRWHHFAPPETPEQTVSGTEVD
jgi:hypothetical protein